MIRPADDKPLISPQYCDVIVKRWETLTGRQAERRESDDQAGR
jgi:hypothetical protein